MKPDYVTVIGHGASAHGAGLGEEIDACPVIRMHDWRWQMDHAADYGTRADWLVWPGPWGDARVTPELVKPALPSRGFLVYTLRDQGRPKRYMPEYAGLPLHVFEAEIEEAFGCLRPFVPSRGSCGIVMASHAYPDVREIRLAGFDTVLAGLHEPYAPHAPHDATGYAQLIGKPANKRHDYEREHDALFAWAALRDIRLVAAGTREPQE